MTTMRYSLIPHGNGAGELRSIHFSKEELPISLGRNTCIKGSLNYIESAIKYASYVSRNHFSLLSRDNAIYLKSVTSQDGLPSVNGLNVNHQQEIELKADDIIALLGSVNMYEYKLSIETIHERFSTSSEPSITSSTVHTVVSSQHEKDYSIEVIDLSLMDHLELHKLIPVSEMKTSSPLYVVSDSQSPAYKTMNMNLTIMEDSSSSTSIKPAPSSLPVIDIAVKCQEAENQFRDLLLRQCECSVCMDIMAFPHVLRCGHSFCYTCIVDFAKSNPKCPVCQSLFTVKETYMNRHLSDNIRELMKSDPQLLAWEERETTARAISMHSTAKNPAPIIATPFQPTPVPVPDPIPVRTNNRPVFGRMHVTDVAFMDRFNGQPTYNPIPSRTKKRRRMKIDDLQDRVNAMNDEDRANFNTRIMMPCIPSRSSSTFQASVIDDDDIEVDKYGFRHRKNVPLPTSSSSSSQRKPPVGVIDLTDSQI